MLFTSNNNYFVGIPGVLLDHLLDGDSVKQRKRRRDVFLISYRGYSFNYRLYTVLLFVLQTSKQMFQ